MSSIIETYISRYPHLATLAAKDPRFFAQNALLLAIPPGLTGIELQQLIKMAAPKRGGWKNPASAENGKRGGRPKKGRLNRD